MFTHFIFQAFKLCSTGEEGFDLSYDSLTSDKAKAALEKRIKDSGDFAKTLSQMEPIGIEGDEEVEDGNQEGTVVNYDEIDSSKTLEEEIADLMTSGGVEEVADPMAIDAEEEIADPMTTDVVDNPLDEDEVCVGTNLEEFVGYEFSTRAATTVWMKWDTKRSH